MSLYNVKKALAYAAKHKCTIEMLFLVDENRSFQGPDDLDEYTGKVTSCMRILEDIPGKPSKKAKKLMEIIDRDLTHMCIMIHMGILGSIDYNYLDKYPECKTMITQVGNIVREYYEDVENIKKLHRMLHDVEDIPEYTMESCTMVAELSSTIDTHKLFERIQEPFQVLMEVSQKGIRRRVNRAFPPRKIDRKYTKPTTAIRPKYVIIKDTNGKDYTFMDRVISIQKKGEEVVDVDVPLDILHGAGYHDISVNVVYDTNLRLQFPHDCIWHRRVMAYIVSNHRPFKDVMKLDTDVNYALPYLKQEKELLPITIIPTGAKCSIRNKGVVISNASNEFSVICTIAIISNLLEIYKELCNDVYKTLSGSSKIPTKGPKKERIYSRTKIEDLREKLPELFASNYTRECHRLPVMLESKKEVKAYEKMGRDVIKYPKSGPYARWYTSPSDDLYVGLKVNRLANKDMFKYIVVCYTSNHLLNPSKRTYQYYFNDDQTKEAKHKDEIKTLKALGNGRKGPIPHMMEAEYGVQGYKRLGTGGSFKHCLDVAMGAHDVAQAVKVNPNLLLLLAQDTTYISITDKRAWQDVDGALFYRLFEEIYRCNIIVVQVDHRGRYRLCIPRNGYIWETCKYPDYVVVLKNIRKLYHDTSITYELIIKEDIYTFSRDDDLVSKLIRVKTQSTTRPYYDRKVHKKDIRKQHIDDEGRCVLVSLKNGSIEECVTRPYPVPRLEEKDVLKNCSILYMHRGDRPWLTTTRDYLYFPDDASFRDWLDR